MLNSIVGTNDDKVLAVFQKFNNKDKYVMLENNELSAGYLDFKSTPTGTPDDLTDSDRIVIFPNPASDFIAISNINPMLKHGVEYSAIKIYNVFGQNCDLTTPLSIHGEYIYIK